MPATKRFFLRLFFAVPAMASAAVIIVTGAALAYPRKDLGSLWCVAKETTEGSTLLLTAIDI